MSVWSTRSLISCPKMLVSLLYIQGSDAGVFASWMKAATEVDVPPYADACVGWKVALWTYRDQNCQESQGQLETSGYIPRRAPYIVDAVEVVGLGCTGASCLQLLAVGDQQRRGEVGRACKNQLSLRCREPVVGGQSVRT
jgi:hypothetical protein